ncbi:MAG: hypothetical protein CL607_28100 [Anaerolineaceae bacterium]|nr:hypothetical protein [Anaerolineaceae bacterium]
MTDSSKRIFLSYRRSVAQHLSLLLFKELRRQGFDVFRDYSSVGPGKFEEIILNQITTRDHFILLLTPGTLDRCNYDEQAEHPKVPNPDDWLRREIEHAIFTGRNIIPLVVDDFSWDNIRPKLTAGLKPLADFNGPTLHTTHDMLFDTSIEILCRDYLTKAVTEATAEPTPKVEEDAEEIIEASESEAVDEKALEAERHFSEGYIASENKDYETAIEKYTQAIELRPKWDFPYNNRGNCYALLGRYEEALADYKHAIMINPNYVEAYSNRGNAYRSLGRYEEALADCDFAISLNSKYADAFNNRGVLYSELEKYDEAIKDYKQAIRFNPRFAEAFSNRAKLFSKLQRNNEALADYKRAIKINPDNVDYYFNRGRAYMDLQRYKQAIIDYNQAIDLDENYAYAYNNRGFCYYRLGNYKAAYRDINKYLDLSPENADAHNNLGVIEFIFGNYLKAKEFLRKTLQLEPDHFFAKANLGITQHAFGEITEAHALWRQLVEKDEHHMDADWVGKEYNWAEPLIEEARKLIASLKGADE